MKTDPQAFIRANTSLMPPPHVPEISLYLASEAHELWLKTEEELQAIGLPPPFWVFAWAGGQGLARYILDHPETVRGKRVLDFASGSGLVGIAAAMAGARDGHTAPMSTRLSATRLPMFTVSNEMELPPPQNTGRARDMTTAISTSSRPPIRFPWTSGRKPSVGSIER